MRRAFIGVLVVIGAAGAWPRAQDAVTPRFPLTASGLALKRGLTPGAFFDVVGRRSAAFGYEGRVDYTAIGSVVNLAQRLCNKASPGEVLIDRKVRAALDDAMRVDTLTPLNLKGYSHPVQAFRLWPPAAVDT